MQVKYCAHCARHAVGCGILCASYAMAGGRHSACVLDGGGGAWYERGCEGLGSCIVKVRTGIMERDTTCKRNKVSKQSRLAGSSCTRERTVLRTSHREKVSLHSCK
jgi:hypothetical protein